MSYRKERGARRVPLVPEHVADDVYLLHVETWTLAKAQDQLGNRPKLVGS